MMLEFNYKTWHARQTDYRNEINKIRNRTPSLAGLIRVTI